MNSENDPSPKPASIQTPEQAERLRRVLEAQGPLHTSTLEHLWGSGKDLWETDEEFEAFLAFIRELRGRKN